MASRSRMLTREEPEDDDRESVQDCRAASDVDHDDEEWVDETNVTQTQKESKRSASAAASRSRTASRSSKLKAEKAKKAKETRNTRKAKKEHQKKLRQAYQVERYLEDAGALRPTDVLLGRGPTLCRHPGNATFRFLCHVIRPVYTFCGKSSKSIMIEAIVAQVASLDPPGRYVEADPAGDKADSYYIVPPGKVYEKTSQSLREAKMACPASFIEVARQIDAASSPEEKDDLYTEATGVDPAVFAEIRQTAEAIVRDAGLHVSFMEGICPKRPAKLPKVSPKTSEKAARRPSFSSSGPRHIWPPPSRASRAQDEQQEQREAAGRDKSTAAQKGQVSKGNKKKTLKETVESGRKLLKAPSGSTAKKESALKTSSPTLAEVEKTSPAMKPIGPTVVPASNRPKKKRPVSETGETTSGVAPKRVVRGKTILPPKPPSLSSGPADGASTTKKKKRPAPKRAPKKAAAKKKRKVDFPEGDSAEQAAPKRKVTKSPRYLSTSKPAAKAVPPVAAQAHPQQSSGSQAEAAAALPPELRSFFSGMMFSGALATSPDSGGATHGDGQQSGVGPLPPSLMSLISGAWGPNQQEWLNAVAKVQESSPSSGTGLTDLLTSSTLLAPQLTSFLSGLFSDNRNENSGGGSDSSSSAVEVGGLDLPFPALVNRLSCTLLAPLDSDAFLPGGGPRLGPASELGGGGSTDASQHGAPQAIVPTGGAVDEESPSAPTTSPQRGAGAAGDDPDGDKKMPARPTPMNYGGAEPTPVGHGGSGGGAVVGHVASEGAHRLAQPSPATVMQKDLGGAGGGRGGGGAVARSAKSSRSLLDDDDDEDDDDDCDGDVYDRGGHRDGDASDNRKKVRAARRLSFRLDLFKHDEEPL